MAKGDAVIRVPRWSWDLARKYAAKAGRDLREVTGDALKEYVGQRTPVGPGEATKIVKHV